MPAVDRPGIYLATIGEHAVAPKGKNQLTAFQAEFHITTEITAEGPADVTPHGFTIQQDFYLDKKDGGFNEPTIKRLMEALEWNGQDIFWMEDSLPADTVVRLEIDWDQPEDPKYKPKLQVKWLNHKDFAGGQGIVKIDKSARAAIKNKFAPALRALNGGSPAAKPPIPTKPPTQPAAAPAPTLVAPPVPITPPAAPRGRGRPPGSTKAPAVTSTLEEAWEALTKDLPDDTSGEYLESEWIRIIKELTGKTADELTPEEWGKVKVDGPAKYVPFATA